MVDLNGAGSATVGGLSAAGAGQVQWWLAEQVSPVNLLVYPALAMPIVFHANTWDNAAVDVRLQVSTSSTFATTIYDALSTSTPESPDTTVIVSGLVNGTTYYWRVRAEYTPASQVGPWSTTWSFLVLIDASDAVEYVYEDVGVEVTQDPDAAEYVYENVGVMQTLDSSAPEYVYMSVGVQQTLDPDAVEYVYLGDVDANTPTPMIWFLMPPSGRAGDGIQIVGFGFGDLQSTYTGAVEVQYPLPIGWVSVGIVSWQTFPADPNAYTELRMLDEVSGYIDMQHTIIEITVPGDAIPPGYPVRVRTDGP